MFTYNIQLAGYPYEKYDEKGKTNLADFIHIFDTFPWLDQLDNYNAIKNGCSATISVKAVGDHNDFWVSIAGNRQKHFFLLGYVYLKTKKGLFGIGKEKVVKWVDIYEIEDKESIKSIFKLFFDKDIDKLKSELLGLKKFDSMEAYIQ